MKLSELIQLCQNAAEYTPTESGVHFGCDCGCGGDFYREHPEFWSEAHSRPELAREKLIVFCKEHGIENDKKGWT